MARYVVDASVVIEYLISGPYTEHTQAFFRERTDTDEGRSGYVRRDTSWMVSPVNGRLCSRAQR